MIRIAQLSDAESIVKLYNHYINNTTITFEEIPVTVEDMQGRIRDVQGAKLPWLVLEQDGEVGGYAYATKWRVRHAYRFSVETTVYLDPGRIGAGLGTRLYKRLLDEIRAKGLHLAIGGIALPNEASVSLHENLGFEKVAHFKEVGFKMDRWLDVGYWQIKL